MGFLRRLRGLQPGEAVILLSSLAINMGFFMLIPFISIHVRENLLLSATIAGTILAVRTGVQQALTVFAGPTADLYGYKPVLLLGLLIRATGFASFAFMTDLNGLLISAVLSGLGGALFSSAERAAYASLSRDADQQIERFALLHIAQAIGTTLGPLLGALFLSVDFATLSLIAGFVYLPIALLVLIYLPNLSSGRVRPSPRRAVGEVFGSIAAVSRNRIFVLYCAISAGYWAISGQINISLSLYASQVTGTQTAVKYLLLISSLMVILLQYRLQSWYAHREHPLRRWVVGSLTSGFAFLLLIPFPAMGGLVACVVLMTFGSMLVRPVDYQMVMGMAPRDSLASYYGFSALSVGFGGSIGQFLGGRLTDLAVTTGYQWLPWVTFAILGIGAGIGMLLFDRYQQTPRKPGLTAQESA